MPLTAGNIGFYEPAIHVRRHSCPEYGIALWTPTLFEESLVQANQHETTEPDSASTRDTLQRGHNFGQFSISDYAKAHLGDHHGDVYNIAGDYHVHAGVPGESAAPDALENFRCLLSWLRFPRQTNRRDMIQPAHKETFQWIFDENTTAHTTSFSVIQWLRQGTGLFWMKGKPGSGKSTLINARPALSSYFFWSQATAMENSDVGLFRSILCDILTTPALGDVAFPGWEPKHAVHEPTLPDVLSAFKRILASADFDRKLCVLIDGLDEYATDSMERTKLVETILELAQSPRIKFLVSGRPLQELEAALHKQPFLVIHQFTMACIRAIITNTLENGFPLCEPDYYKASDTSQIIEGVVAGSSGVFLWAVLAARSIAEGMNMRDTLQKLQSRVAELPPELGQLFTLMIQKFHPRYRAEAYRLLRIAHYWYNNIFTEPLPAIVLSFASEFEMFPKDLRPEQVATTDGSSTQRLDRLEIRLRSSCLGLLDMRIGYGSGYPGGPAYFTDHTTVQFMHKSVLDYLTNPEVWHQISPSNEAEFDVHLAVLTGLFAATEIQARWANSWKVWVKAMYFIAKATQRAEASTTSAYANILDAFDGILTRIWNTEVARSKYLSDDERRRNQEHWTNHLVDYGGETPDGHLDNFLSFAVKHGFEKYVQEKLRNVPGSVTSKRGRPLLDYAVYPYPNWTSISDLMRPRLVRLLFDHGADANEVFGGQTPWTNALYFVQEFIFVDNYMFGDPSHGYWLTGTVARRPFTEELETLEVMLEGGANPHACCVSRHSRGGDNEIKRYSLQRVLDHALQTHCPGAATTRHVELRAVPFASCDCSLAFDIRSCVHSLRRYAAGEFSGSSTSNFQPIEYELIKEEPAGIDMEWIES